MTTHPHKFVTIYVQNIEHTHRVDMLAASKSHQNSPLYVIMTHDSTQRYSWQLILISS